jgi:hydroxyacylglutathione hydrolase
MHDTSDRTEERLIMRALFHRVRVPVIRSRMSTMAAVSSYTVTAIPLFSDNYCWRIDNNSESLLVDPADASPCLQTFSAPDSSTLVAVLSTHYHADHARDNAAIAAAVPGLAVIDGAAEGVRMFTTRVVDDLDSLKLAGLDITCFHTPCHTRGHTLYYIPGEPGSLFTGDTLFSGGCGRFFEGSAEQMLSALDRIAALPPDTRVYCGHEYTVANLHFCLLVEPENEETSRRLAACIELRAAGKPTVPSTIALELATNVFMRTREPTVISFTNGVADPVQVMSRLRQAKNDFKPPGLVS